jgi:uroporphyrinogen-III decarboxylase
MGLSDGWAALNLEMPPRVPRTEYSVLGHWDLLEGSRPQIRTEVERCMAIGKDCPGYIMAVGNHIPANTPVENAIYYNEVLEELRGR